MSLPPLVEPAAELTVDEVRRYSRHLIIPDVGMAGQKRLKNAKVLVRRRRRPRLAGADVPGRRRRRHARHRRVRHRRRVQPAAPDHPRPVPTSAGPRPSRAADVDRARSTRTSTCVLHEERLDSANVMEIFARLRPDRRRHRQLRHPLPRQRRVRAAGQALRLGLDLPLRRPGVGLLGRARPLLPLPLPRAPAARHGAVAAPRAASSACCARRIGSIQVNEAIKLLTGIGDPLVGRLMIYDALEMTYRKRQGPQGPRVRGLRQEPDGHRADRLRGVLRHDLRGGRRGRARLDDLGQGPQGDDRRGRRRTSS